MRSLALSVLLVGSASFSPVVRAVSAQSTVPRLTADDYADILQLYFKYPIAIDSGDAEGYAALFTPDGSFNNNVGHDALIAFIKNRQPSTVRHAPLTPAITPTATGASGMVLNLFIDVAQTPAVVTRASMYTDTLVKTPAGWRFKTRVNGSAIFGGTAPAGAAPGSGSPAPGTGAAPGRGGGVAPAPGGGAAVGGRGTPN